MKMVEMQSKTLYQIIGEFEKSTTLASMESLSMPEVQEVVFLADLGCSNCQERVAQLISKMNGEMQSEVVSVREKEVTLTFTNPKSNMKPSSTKLAFIMRLFSSGT